jgi:hypothetical protein
MIQSIKATYDLSMYVYFLHINDGNIMHAFYLPQNVVNAFKEQA